MQELRISDTMRNTIRLFNIYFAFTIIYYCTGQWKWNIPSYFKLVAFLLICYTMLNVGYSFVKVRRHAYLHTYQRPVSTYEIDYPSLRTLFLVSSIALIIFQIAWVIVFFGSFSITNVFSVLGNNYFNRLSTTFESSIPIMQVRTLLWGITLFCYPIGFLYFRKMPSIDKLIFILTIGVDIFASLNMGISKNIGDIVVIFISTFLLKLSSRDVKERKKIGSTTRKVILALIIFLVMFSQIQNARHLTYSGKTNPYGAFATTREITWYNLIFGKESTITNLIQSIGGYVSNSYTGLAYALELPFKNTWGIGFSRALMEYVEQYLHIGLSANTYNARVEALYGWHDGMWWPTAFTWIANSVSIWGVPIIMLILGVFIRYLEDEYARTKDIVVAVLYGQMIITLFYLPCNMQVFQSRASLFGMILLFILLIYRKKQRKVIRAEYCSVDYIK